MGSPDESPMLRPLNLDAMEFILTDRNLLVHLIPHLEPFVAIMFLKNRDFPLSEGENDKYSYLYIINMGSGQVVPLNNQNSGEPILWGDFTWFSNVSQHVRKK